jgi:hypothetical protein
MFLHISAVEKADLSRLSMRGRLSNTKRSRTRAKHRQKNSRFNADLAAFLYAASIMLLVRRLARAS